MGTHISTHPRFSSVLYLLSHCLERLSWSERERALVGSLILSWGNKPEQQRWACWLLQQREDKFLMSELGRMRKCLPRTKPDSSKDTTDQEPSCCLTTGLNCRGNSWKRRSDQIIGKVTSNYRSESHLFQSTKPFQKIHINTIKGGKALDSRSVMVVAIPWSLAMSTCSPVSL